MNVRRRLRKNWERVRTEPGLKKNVTVLALLLVLATAAGSWVLGNQRFTAPWADRFEFAAEFEAVPGVAPGNGQEVRMHGVIVGQITDAHVNDEGRAELTMSLDPGYDVYDNAKLVLRPKSPLNEMYVEVDPGGAPGTKLASGETLPVTNTARPVQVDEVLGHLDDQARSALTTLLAEADVALVSADETLPAGLDQTREVAGDLRPVLLELERRRGQLATLVTALSDISDAVASDDERLTTLADGLSSTVRTIAGQSDDLDATLAQLPGLATRLASSTKAVSDLTEQLDPTLRDIHDATGTLPKALKRIDSTVNRLSTTVRVARPTIAHARPLVADLRPVVADLRQALPVAARSTARLDPATAMLTRYLPDLGAFIVNTHSLTSLRDANGGILRGLLTVNSTSLPTDALAGLAGN
ncbi:MAG: MlaD family protein [Propionibacteriales bacterium]|nr:MlaD family protein [Propionibacteriales bacterium]